MGRISGFMVTAMVSAGVSGCVRTSSPPPIIARSTPPGLPPVGLSAHRGASSSYPENTLAAIRAAVVAGVQQIEMDVRSTADGALVLMHDRSVDRSTNGSGPLAGLGLSQVRKLDAGVWRGERFRGERVPTLAEALDAVPRDRWINLDVKGGPRLAQAAAALVSERRELDRVIFATRGHAPEAVRAMAPEAWICDMDRGLTRSGYIEDAAARGADFVQFRSRRGLPDDEEIARAHELGLRVNFCCAEDARQAADVLERGVDFALVDDAPAVIRDDAVRDLLARRGEEEGDPP